MGVYFRPCFARVVITHPFSCAGRKIKPIIIIVSHDRFGIYDRLKSDYHSTITFLTLVCFEGWEETGRKGKKKKGEQKGPIFQGCVFLLEMKLISDAFLIESFRCHHLYQYLSDFYHSKCI